MRNRKSSQKKLVNELKNQLMIQAERLGIKDDYTPLYFEEVKLDSVKKILTEFYMERANLEYEIQMLESDKKELLIKLERLHAYIRKAIGLHERHVQKYEDIIEKATGDQKLTRLALKKHQDPVKVSAAA
ncbi:MAG: hypothetical protein JW782_06570 [Candidatus Saganbacteria bacterium]|nr:hypothetical protein [Candidatus Saganbacteria bacterium]